MLVFKVCLNKLLHADQEPRSSERRRDNSCALHCWCEPGKQLRKKTSYSWNEKRKEVKRSKRRNQPTNRPNNRAFTFSFSLSRGRSSRTVVKAVFAASVVALGNKQASKQTKQNKAQAKRNLDKQSTTDSRCTAVQPVSQCVVPDLYRWLLLVSALLRLRPSSTVPTSLQ